MVWSDGKDQNLFSKEKRFGKCIVCGKKFKRLSPKHKTCRKCKRIDRPKLQYKYIKVNNSH